MKDLVRHMMDNVCQVYRGKSATVSKQRRLEAEHLYSNGEPDRALLMFTQSVVKAPSAGKKNRIRSRVRTRIPFVRY